MRKFRSKAGARLNFQQEFWQIDERLASCHAVAQAVQGAALQSIYEMPANAPVLAYFPDPAAPSTRAPVQTLTT